MKTRRAILMIVAILSAASCRHTQMPIELATVPWTPAQKLCKTLDSQLPRDLLPEIATHTPAEWAATPMGAQLLESAKSVASVTTIPETTYTRYRMFKTAGERAPYDQPHGQKRSLLRGEVLAAWLQSDDSRIDRINDLIWSICEETTWVGSAHEKTEWNIDLYAAETGADLAYILMLLGDRLPQEIRDRVRKEIDRRIFAPYLEHAHEFWWDSGRNNWTGVCAGSIGEAFLLLENDTARLAEALDLIVGQLDRFIEIAFEPDGGCLEGIGYWNYGLLHYVSFAEMLRIRTGGDIDLLANEKVKLIAAYPLAVVIGDQTYASFSDAHERAAVRPFLAARLAERAGATGLLALTADSAGGRLGEALRDLSWWDGVRRAMPPLEDSILAASGVARLVSAAGPHTLVVAAKAGHNAEPHNHNDIGSFIVAVDGEVYLCDPGSGLYDAAYFSSRRYDNVFANSYGHSVPRIDGALQRTGEEFRGTMEKTGDKVIAIRFEKAYGLPALTEARRSIEITNGEVILQDEFNIEGGAEVEEAFMTWHNVETNGNVARVVTEKGILEIRADNGVFTAEKLEAACKANRKKDILTRIAIAYPAAQKTRTRFAILFHPKP